VVLGVGKHGAKCGAPQLAKDGVEDDPEAVSFWKVKHGIRFTAMPSFAPTLQDEQIWKIAMFLKRMDKLPPPSQCRVEESTQCCSHSVTEITATPCVTGAQNNSSVAEEKLCWQVKIPDLFRTRARSMAQEVSSERR
jgi:Cytochrome C oxidase, cbb3-type, subunit III